jgi:signal transduction histidine kinase
VASSITEPSPGDALDPVGAAFRLLMLMRMLMASIALLLLPRNRLTFTTIFLVVCVAVLSWIMARHQDRIVPHILGHPLLVALDVGVSFAVLALGGPTGPFFLSTVATAMTAGLLFRWPGMLAVSALQILCYYGTIAFAPPQQHAALITFQALVGQPAYYPLVGFAGVALRGLFDDRAAAEAIRRDAESAAAAADERVRLARDMHDSLAKTLRGIAIEAAALPLWIARDPERTKREIARIAADADIAFVEARDLIRGLRDNSAILPLPEAVRAVATRWCAANGVEIRCETDPDADLPLRARHEAVAVCAEALANVARHAEATSVTVRLTKEEAAVVLTISDNGRGFHMTSLEDVARAGHYGLLGLRERTESVDGVMSVVSAPGAGTTVVVRLPSLPPLAPRTSAGGLGTAWVG